MTKFKVEAVHYVEAADWKDAETQVEMQLSEPEEVVSKPATDSPNDYIAFGISKKILEEHNALFFKSENDVEYEQKLNILKESLLVWLTNIALNVIANNEKNWE